MRYSAPGRGARHGLQPRQTNRRARGGWPWGASGRGEIDRRPSGDANVDLNTASRAARDHIT
jgi:hypothetical protein